MANEALLDIGALKRRRATILGSCTRVRTFVDAVVAVTPAITAQLEVRRTKLESYWADYDRVQADIECLDESESHYRASFEEGFFDTSARIRELLDPVASARGATTPTTSSSVAAADAYNHVRLPKLNLPTFSGKYNEWLPFYDTFRAVIHLNDTLSEVQKLQYLKASLTGDASDIISALEISDANYEVAWNLLRERYDNRRVIVEGHVQAIMTLPSVTRENAVDLRRIADGAARHVQALQALRRPTSQWDDLLIYVLSHKLDSVTFREWRLSLTGSELPTLKQLIDFIAHRCQNLETSTSVSPSLRDTTSRSRPNMKRQAAHLVTVKPKCSLCNKEHSIYYCQDFLAMSIPKRIAEMRKRKICANCLRSTDHSSAKCTSGACRICKRKHNTLLHLASTATEPSKHETEELELATPVSTPAALTAQHSGVSSTQHVMLSTAVIQAYDSDGGRRSCRTLLDSGSQANFISRRFLTVLGLKPSPMDISISGIGRTTAQAFSAVKVRLQSRVNSYNLSLTCIVVDRVTDKLPSLATRRSAFAIPQNLILADPQFHVPSEVDILIGAEHFWELMCVGQIKASQEHPTLQKTRFGWILAGRFDLPRAREQAVQSFHASITNTQLHEQLSRFWRIEDAADGAANLTAEEAACEQHFLQNVYRTPQGRFVVKLPFKQPTLPELGESRKVALKRLGSLERRFARDAELKAQYSSFLREYLSMGHMRRVGEQGSDNSPPGGFYLPHHGVFKNSSDSAKIRVVFDASCKGSTGISLNDMLMTGPTIQQDLFSILVRFRSFLFVFAADIAKMYRQILVDPSQTHYQRILWRNEPTMEPETYELLTVTYGTSSASFLSTRCLKALAEEHASEYPHGSTCIARDFYVDDLLTGADTISRAKIIREETIKLLQLGCFELSKWASNCTELLANLDNPTTNHVQINSDIESSILGIQWNQFHDTFNFSHIPAHSNKPVSKRTILSEISRLFDPLGLLGPIVVLAKLILQDIWKLGSHWDEAVPPDLHTRWSDLKSGLGKIDNLAIPRCVKHTADRSTTQIHGFCDASQIAYGACIYVRTKINNKEYRAELLCSKSRVAPLKAISLPRLELSAASLLARLMKGVAASIDASGIQIFLWSDSTIALSWIVSPSRKWSVFVANRIGEIQTLTNPNDWRHVRSADNPADLLSRGLHPSRLIGSSMWWHGPSFLQNNEELWPKDEIARPIGNLPELRVLTNVTTLEQPIIIQLLNDHSSLSKTGRIISYCLRFVKARRPTACTAFISHGEAALALQLICKAVQKQTFPSEYSALLNGSNVCAVSKILSLSPFMGQDGLIRVGGRLSNSDLSFEACHPILLPQSHILTRRIIEREHIRNAHSGVQATMAAVRQRFWPIALRSTTRKLLKNCVTCFRNKPTLSEAIMGSLPAGRVTVSRPFTNCGVDYAGPFLVRESKRRNARAEKAYLAIFVCFATKGVHLELVSDLTSASFIAALKRFAARRGKPLCIYSDNGTTFVGAQRQLREFAEMLTDSRTQVDLQLFLRDHETSWRFIPPNAPHFGGLWEAAVKSAKYHLQRIVGGARLTFEELQTVFCEIEAILNSRPLTPLSSDPNDLSCLTAGHFLVGTALNSPPCDNLCDVPENRLIRWQRVEQLRQHFWQRWSQEYLHTLQERSKWKMNKGKQLQPGQMVLIRQSGLAPLQWLLGRVEEIHPGPDNVVRTATIRTARGSFTRPLAKLSILPMES